MSDIQRVLSPLKTPGLVALGLLTLSLSVAAQVVNVDQGRKWSQGDREEFYTQDQGSRIMLLAWIKALKDNNGNPFLSDSLGRYGYLPNPSNSEPDIPVGFTVAGDADSAYIGMTCAACHTRQIEVNGTSYRIDGGPAIVDFQSFLQDLDDAVRRLNNAAAFDAFANQVLGTNPTPAQKEQLKVEVDLWNLRFHTLVDRSLPNPAWGPARLYAVSMIFNRLTGLDIGPPPTYLIADNILRADAPTRYPFLWNAARQDKPQWPGFADNGNEILGLARNLGEVYGVFAIFHPVRQTGLLNVDYITSNSANFEGLKDLEDLIWQIGPPKWPWQINSTLAARGEEIYKRSTSDGGCTDGHGITRGAFRSLLHETWKTPIVNAGTDTREWDVLGRTADSGVLEGAHIPGVAPPLKKTDTAFNILTMSALGGIVQHTLDWWAPRDKTTALNAVQRPSELESLRGAFPGEDELARSATGYGAYEARVMEGVWAAAPYLHNGSVPTLAELLRPASERMQSFKIGPNYDIENIGLAVEQTAFDYVLETTGCDELDSGNSRCGHEYGTTLSADEKAALLEYLKQL